MVDVIKITLWGQDLGALYWDRNQNFGSFEFFPEFINLSWNVSPIHMPLENSLEKIYSFPALNQDTFTGLPGMLSDVLPDDFGNLLINQWLSINAINRSDFTPLDRLCYIGNRGMGALEFKPAKNIGGNKASEVAIDKLVELSELILKKRTNLRLNLDDTNHLNELIKVGTSAGGQRAKAILAFNPETKEIRSGQTEIPKGFEHYLFKFDGINNEQLGDPVGYGRIEYAYYLMAIDCGIDMMPSELFEENQRAHFMTKRFDRVNGGEKLHMQTLCSMAHFDYKKPGQYGYEDAFEILRLLRLPHTQAIQLFKRMVFNVITRNQDDHTKNISFLMDKKGIWKLSPAYDVTYSYNPNGIWTHSHQMTINGKRDHITFSDLIQVGNKISYKQSHQAVEEIVHRISEWPQYAEKAGIPSNQASLLGRSFRRLQ